MTSDEQSDHERAVDAVLWDIAAALATLERSEPGAYERYRRDPQYQAEVNELMRLARAMADKAKAASRQDILRSPGDRRQYEIDEEFRDEVEERIIKAAIDTIKSLPPDEVVPEDETTKH